MVTEPDKFIAFIDGSNIGIFNTLNEANTAVGNAIGRGMGHKTGNNTSIFVEIRNSRTYQIEAQGYR